MTFVQIEFPFLLAIALIVYWQLGHRGKNRLLVAVSLVFYGWIHHWFVLLLLGSATVDYAAARGMTAQPESRWRFLKLSLLSNIAMLGTFKYFNFFAENAVATLQSLGVAATGPTVHILLPVGISFYTFQTVSYSIDVYRGRTHARTNFVDYLLYVSFFPQLVAGPIERAGHLLPQFEKDREFSWANLSSGITLAMWGAFKKVLIADSLAPHVDAIYALEHPASALAWAGAVGFIVQMLADFTGYVDIARGVARMFGIHLIRNFNHPYLARTPFDLWDRWHISLSDWLRDYIFYPASTWKWARRWIRIPGVRESGFTTLARASLITMMFAGIWHGAAWNFVVWGLFWATVQIGWLYGERKVPRSWRKWRWRWVPQISAMFVIHLFAHQIFRERDVSRLWGYFVESPFVATPEEWAVVVFTLSYAGVCAGFLTGVMLLEFTVLDRLRAHRSWLVWQTLWWCVAAWAILAAGSSSQPDFVYFAF